ncbi:MAG: glutamine amidotransferase [Planctomycetota bacterium]
MILADVGLGAPQWLAGAVVLTVLGLVALVISYRRSGARSWWRATAVTLKGIGIIALAACLIEPLYTGTRPRPGSNLFLVVADNSRSLQLSDQGQSQSRGDLIKDRLKEDSPWLARLGQDFDVRRYVFDIHLRSVKEFEELTFAGEASSLKNSLAALADRFRGQPVAGILLLTDGNATDLAEGTIGVQGLPPIYPVTISTDSGLVDLSVTQVAVSQTNFEAAPVTITATVEGRSVPGNKIGLRLLDEAGKEIERRDITKPDEGQAIVERFLVRPEKSGVSFYTVQACLPGEEKLTVEAPAGSREATLANNRRLVTVDRGKGPFRVLYVTGRPNWEYKFLRRALAEDDEVQLLGLVRIAKREPKFKFLSRAGERTNPLFRGFGNQTDEQAEQYDEPVLLRLGINDPDELRGGFPKSSEDLFRYQAIILDDIEAGFFTADQQSLLQQFVSRRGGALLMLGGRDSFVEGGYQRAAIGEMLPVYLDRTDGTPGEGGYRLALTREGWLQSWIRVRDNEQDEQARLTAMPEFHSLNHVRATKPGSAVLAQVTAADGTERPALIAQQFGRGRTAARLIGDLWRWNLRRPEGAESDLEKSWRQTVRWLVSDVPGRIEVETKRTVTGAVPAVQILVRARDSNFEPLDNSTVKLQVQTPDKQSIELNGESSDQSAGQYSALFAPRIPGAYRAKVMVTAPDGSEVGTREIGWTAEPQTEEFRTLAVNQSLLQQIAQQSGGEVIAANGLEQFVGSLPNRKVPIVETWTYPLWHQSAVFLVAIACLIGEWGLRRWKGMP